jgi:hypothetical protein
MLDPSQPEQPTRRDPLGLMTDTEYLAWLDAGDRRPVTDEERAEIIEATTPAASSERD